MSDSLAARLHRVRRRVRRLLWTYGLSWVAAVALSGVFLAGFLDWLVHLDDPGVRLILGLAILGGAGWSAWRFLIGPLRRPLDDLELALRIERRFPGFKDSLASTVQFLEPAGDPRVGSPALQQRVIDETVAALENVSLADVIETRQVRRVGIVAAAIVAGVALVAALNKPDAALALHRLAFPFHAGAWPRRVELHLLRADFSPFSGAEGLRMARGESLELFVENSKGQLPADLVMQYQIADEPATAQKLRTSTLRDDAGGPHEVGALWLSLTDGPLRFRAVGGDDDRMPWHRVEVVPPPEVETIRVTVTPPDYIGTPPKSLPEGAGHVEGIAGSTVEIEARANKPLRSARLSLKNGRTQPIVVAGDGFGFHTAFALEAGVSSYWFDLTDREGFENPRAPQYEIRGIADLVPSVYIDDPSSDLQVTANAEVPLRIVAKDDLGLTEMSLHYQLGETEGTAAQQVLLNTAAKPQEQAVVERTWKLAELALSQGTRVVFHAQARDEYNLDLEHVGESVARTLIVVSPEEKAVELASRQTGLLEELDRVHEMQQQAHGQTGELESQMSQVGRLRPQDIDFLKRIELDQGHIAARLDDPMDGVAARAAELLEELRENKIDDPDTARRLEQIVDELGALSRDHLPVIEQQLTLARKQAQMDGGGPAANSPEQPPSETKSPDEDAAPTAKNAGPQGKRTSPDGPADASRSDAHPVAGSQTGVSQSLAVARENQKVVLESVETLLDRLSEWRDQRELSQELHDAIAAQEQMIRDTTAAGEKLLTRPLANLSRQERADLERLADRQAQQADRVDELLAKLNGAADAAEKSNAATGDRFRAAAEHLADEMIASRMRESADRLAENNIGQAAEGQQQALADLQTAEEILENRESTDTETLIKKLKQAEEQIEALANQQDELRRLTHEAADGEDAAELQRLLQQQLLLREEAGGLSRRLKRMRASRPGELAGRAEARMSDAENQLGRSDPKGAVDDQQAALDELEQARREVARDRIQTEERLAREMLERIAGSLDAMIARQQSAIDETNRLEGERASRGNWSRGQLKSLSNLEVEQRRLTTETGELAEKLRAAPVFALALRGAARQMELAANRLAERQTGADTVAREEAARRRFADLRAALEPEQSPPQPEQEAAADPDGPGNDAGPPAEGIPPIAQLKMLTALQEDLLSRTTELDAARDRGNQLAPEHLAELETLAREQEELADLARNLTQNLSGPAEEPQEKPKAK